MTHFHQPRVATFETFQPSRRFIRSPGRRHERELRKLLGQLSRLIRTGVRQQDHQIDVLGLDLRNDFFQRLTGIHDLQQVGFAEFLSLLGGEDRRHADAFAADFRHDESLGEAALEIDEGHVGRNQWVFRQVGRRRDQVLAQLQIAGAEADRRVIEDGECFQRAIQFEAGLRSEPFDLATHVEREDGPAAVAQLLDERVPSLQATLLILEARTSARFDVAVLLTRKQQREGGLLPAFEDRTVLEDRVDFGFLVRFVSVAADCGRESLLAGHMLHRFISCVTLHGVLYGGGLACSGGGLGHRDCV